MRQIRRNVFETNSSSTHSITMCTSSEYNDWQNGKVYLNDSYIGSNSQYKDKKFVTKEEIVDIYAKSTHRELIDINDPNFESKIWNDDFYSYDRYWDEKEECFETFEESCMTPSGEEVIAFGYYGYDG
jgi:hypothetical protein